MNIFRCLFLATAFSIIVSAAGVFAQQSQEFGWVPDKEKTDKFVASLPPVYENQVEQLVEGDNNEDALLYRTLVPCLVAHGKTEWLKVRGEWKVVNAYNQNPTGSCVGNAGAAVTSVLNAVEVVLKNEPQEFVSMHSADGMYGLGREADGLLGRSFDGMSGSGMAKAITQMGTLYCVDYPSAGVNLTQNSPARQKQYGRSGVGAALKAEALNHKVASATRVKSAQEAWSLLGNGYPINVCSTQGFSKTRDTEGVIKPSGSWNHSMSVIGRRTTKDGRKLFLIWNSWGNNWANGPYWQDMPEGSFFIEWKVMDSMLAKGDSFAYGGLEGFKKRGLDDLGTKEYLGMLKIGGSDEQITPCLLCFGGRVSDCPHCGAGYAHERRNKDSKPSIDKLLDVSRTLADHATRSGHGTQRAGVRVPVGPGSDNAKHGPVHSSP